MQVAWYFDWFGETIFSTLDALVVVALCGICRPAENTSQYASYGQMPADEDDEPVDVEMCTLDEEGVADENDLYDDMLEDDVRVDDKTADDNDGDGGDDSATRDS